MKRFFAAILLIALLAGLCACGSAPADVPSEPTATPTVTTKPTPQVTAGPEQGGEPEETAEPSAEPSGEPVQTETPAQTQSPVPATQEPQESTGGDLKAIALGMVGQPVSALYAAVGYPLSSDYAPSCLGEGGEDGNLYYDGFTVYTYREGETETVNYVE